MKDTKAYIALESLTVYELNRFGKFINSPYFNINNSLTSLFQVLDKNIRADKTTELSKSTVWKSLYSNTSFDDVRFRKLCSDLLKLIEKFLSQEQFDNNSLHRANYLLKAVSSKSLEKLYSSSISTARRLSKQQLEKTASYYYYQYQIEKNLFSLTSEFEKKAKVKSDTSIINISDIAHNLDIFYLAEKIKYQCSLLEYRNVVTIENDKILFIEDILKQIQNMDFESIPPIAIYYQIYLTLTEPKIETHFQKLKELIDEYLSIFPFDEAKGIYESAINFCVKRINTGDQNYLNELFELYQYGLEHNIMLIRNEISPTSFRNICFIGVRLNKYDWTENFIHSYSAQLNSKYRKNAVTFNLARLNIYKKDYNKVIEYLREVTFDDVVYELSSRAIQVVAYYELDEIDALSAYLSSFKTFLRRNKKIPDRRKNNYKRMIEFTQKLIRLAPHMTKEIKKLEEEIQDSENFSDKKWILEKLKELQGLPVG